MPINSIKLSNSDNNYINDIRLSEYITTEIINSSVGNFNHCGKFTNYYLSPYKLYEEYKNNNFQYIDIDYYIVKTTDSTVNIYGGLYIDDNGYFISDYEIKDTFTINAQYLDESYGANVYKIPVFKRVNYLPAINRNYVHLNAGNDIIDDYGYVFISDSIVWDEDITGKEHLGTLAFGAVITKMSLLTQTVADALYVKKEDLPPMPTFESHWKNKKVGFLGDSITSQGYYVNSYAQLTNCNAINYGISGTHLAKKTVNDTTAFEVRYANMADDLDLVIVFGGTNDFGNLHVTAPFGEFSDGYDSNKNTYYAGLHRLCKGLYEKYIDKPIVIMTPVHHGCELDQIEYSWTESGGVIEHKNTFTDKTFKEYVEAIKEIAQFYSLPIIDAYSYSRMTPLMEIGSGNHHYYGDGLHLSKLGGLKLARFMYTQLEDIYEQFYS